MNKTTWKFSAKDSAVEFKIKYYKISSLPGHFKDFRGKVIAYDNFANADIRISVDAASVNLNDNRSNKQFRSNECLDTKNFPNIEFEASKGCKLSEGNIREITGFLTIKNITREITLVISYSEIKKGSRSPVMIFGLFGCISRKDFNLYAEEDRLADDVHLTARIELSRSRL